MRFASLQTTPESRMFLRSIKNILIPMSVTAPISEPVLGPYQCTEPVLGPYQCTAFFARPAMHSSDSEHLSDDSGAGDDPHQSRAVPNSLL